MAYDNIDTTRYDDLIEDAKAELRVQRVTARTSVLTTLLFAAVSIGAYAAKGDGALEIPLTAISVLGIIAAAVLLVLSVLMYGIGVAGAKQLLERHERRRNAFVLKKMAAEDYSSDLSSE